MSGGAASLGPARPARRRPWPALLALPALPVMAGCSVGPNFHAPAAPPVAGILPGRLATGSGTQRFADGADIPGQWWRLFRSRALTDLVGRALQQNADIQAAQAALRAARENAASARGAFYPQVIANLNPTAGRVSSDVQSPLATNSLTYSLTTAQLTVSYSPDVFGLTRRTVESADAQTRQQNFQVEATYLTLTSNVVLAAIQEASTRAQIEATRKVIKTATDLLTILRRQFAAGQVANADVLVQTAALAQAQQALPPLEKQLGQTRDQLTALAGQYSSDEVAETFSFGSLHLPRELPVSLPSTLVAHRPDVQAAQANLASASAQVGVAVANRLPVVNLTAQGGSSPANFANLFAPQTFFYALGANVAQTVFDGGTLYHRQKQAEAEYDQAYQQYRSTVITAFQNVADALRALQTDGAAVAAAVASERAAEKSLKIATEQLQVGQVGAAIILVAQQTYAQAQLTRLQAEAGRFSDTAALFQALGGGWWNRSDPQ